MSCRIQARQQRAHHIQLPNVIEPSTVSAKIVFWFPLYASRQIYRSYQCIRSL